MAQKLQQILTRMTVKTFVARHLLIAQIMLQNGQATNFYAETKVLLVLVYEGHGSWKYWVGYIQWCKKYSKSVIK